MLVFGAVNSKEISKFLMKGVHILVLAAMFSPAIIQTESYLTGLFYFIFTRNQHNPILWCVCLLMILQEWDVVGFLEK